MKHFISNSHTNWVLIHADPLRAQMSDTRIFDNMPNPVIEKAIAHCEPIIGWEIRDGQPPQPITLDGPALLDLGSAIFDLSNKTYLPIHNQNRWLSEMEFVDHLFGYDYSALNVESEHD